MSTLTDSKPPSGNFRDIVESQIVSAESICSLEQLSLAKIVNDDAKDIMHDMIRLREVR